MSTCSYLVFLAVHCFSAVPLLEEVRLEGTIEYLAIHLGVAVSLVADDLQESSASTSRLAEDKNHLARFHYTLEAFENIELLALLAFANQASNGLENVEK